MKLLYRATTYDYNPAKAPRRHFHSTRKSGPAYDLTYRGVTYRVDPNAKPTQSVQPATYELFYRGVSYLVNRTAQGKVSVVNQPARATKMGSFPGKVLDLLFLRN